MTRRFRHALPPDDGFRCSFLGHIVTESLLDGVLMDQDPTLLDRYYGQLSLVSADLVQNSVNAIARQPTEHLARFIEIYRP